MTYVVPFLDTVDDARRELQLLRTDVDSSLPEGWQTVNPFYNDAGTTRWAHNGSRTCKYRRRDGNVELQGCAQNTGGTFGFGASSSWIFQLPVGYRPAQDVYVLVPALDSAAAGSDWNAVILLIQASTGIIAVQGGVTGNTVNGSTDTLVFLFGLSFPIAGAA